MYTIKTFPLAGLPKKVTMLRIFEEPLNDGKQNVRCCDIHTMVINKIPSMLQECLRFVAETSPDRYSLPIILGFEVAEAITRQI